MTPFFIEQQLIDFVERMPAFPNSVRRLMQINSDISADSKEIVQIIESDPVMTVKVLKVINSPFYGLQQRISSVQRAVVHIGINTIKNMAISIAAMGAMPKYNRVGFDTQAFLLHSVSTAMLSKLLAERLQVPIHLHSDYFVAGLLHDFGKIVFAEFAPEQYQAVLQACLVEQRSLFDLEMEMLGLDHSGAGRMLAEHWGFDQSLIDAVDHHHNQHVMGDINICLFAANQVSKKLQLGFSGNVLVEEFPDEVVGRLGLGLDELLMELGDIAHIRDEALSLMRL